MKLKERFFLKRPIPIERNCCIAVSSELKYIPLTGKRQGPRDYRETKGHILEKWKFARPPPQAYNSRKQQPCDQPNKQR